ncbi:MAG: YdcF family protein, partial [Candidatus Omnitrophica bacterium]|nr:YdcF family protein [Candidatus Omnitrophota bacterium]
LTEPGETNVHKAAEWVIKTLGLSRFAPDRVTSVAVESVHFVMPANLGRCIIDKDTGLLYLERPEVLAELEGDYQDRFKQIIGFISHYINGPPLEVKIIIEPVQVGKPTIWYDPAANTIHIQIILLTDLIPLEYAYFVAHHDFIIHAYEQVLEEALANQKSAIFLFNNPALIENIRHFFKNSNLIRVKTGNSLLITLLLEFIPGISPYSIIKLLFNSSFRAGDKRQGFVDAQYLRHLIRTLSLASLTEIFEAIMREFPAIREYLLAQELTSLLTQKGDLPEQADVVIICGSDEIQTIREAAKLYHNGLVKFIFATGGQGRLTIPLIEAVVQAYGSIRDRKNIKQMLPELKRLYKQGRLNEQVKIGEAEIIRELLITQFNVPEEAILMETKSRNTPENFIYAKEELERLARNKGIEFRNVIFIQTPIQQFRANATFNKVFWQELKQGSVRGISWTIDYVPMGVIPQGSIDALIQEAWKIIVYTAKGDLIPQFGRVRIDDIVEGLNSIPENYWRVTKELIANHSNISSLRNSLIKISEGAGQNRERLLNRLAGVNSEIRQLIEYVYQRNNPTADDLLKELVAVIRDNLRSRVNEPGREVKIEQELEPQYLALIEEHRNNKTFLNLMQEMLGGLRDDPAINSDPVVHDCVQMLYGIISFLLEQEASKDSPKDEAHNITVRALLEAPGKYSFAKPFRQEFINLGEDIKEIIQFLRGAGKITFLSQEFDAETFALAYHEKGQMHWAENITELDVEWAIRDLTYRKRLNFSHSVIITHIYAHERQFSERQAIKVHADKFREKREFTGGIIKKLDASSNLQWNLIRDNPEAREEFRSRSDLLAEAEAVRLVKDELI